MLYHHWIDAGQKVMEKFRWWFRWWVWVAAISLGILFFSEPPQLWFWLTIFVVSVLYGLERSLL